MPDDARTEDVPILTVEGYLWDCGHHHSTRGEAVACKASMAQAQAHLGPSSFNDGGNREEEASASVLTETHSPITAVDICAEAARLVGGARAQTHGNKDANFTHIAALWNGYMIARAEHATPITLDAIDIGNMMELLKIARRLTGSFNADDYIDAAGYASCTGEIAAACEQQ